MLAHDVGVDTPRVEIHGFAQVEAEASGIQDGATAEDAASGEARELSRTQGHDV